MSVTVTFNDLPSGSTLVAADDHCKTELGVAANSCAWFSIVGSDAKTYNATAAPSADGRSLVLSASVPAGTTAAASSRYTPHAPESVRGGLEPPESLSSLTNPTPPRHKTPTTPTKPSATINGPSTRS